MYRKSGHQLMPVPPHAIPRPHTQVDHTGAIGPDGNSTIVVTNLGRVLTLFRFIVTVHIAIWLSYIVHVCKTTFNKVLILIWKT